MNRWLLTASLILLHARVDLAAGKKSYLPRSFVLLPLSSFTNASLIAPYNCDPVLTYHSCSNHGDCQLLLDSAASYSQPFLRASSAPTVSACDTSLDTNDMNVHTPLPVAVCLCHAGYTGRGDYINHFAMDSDSCAIYQPAVVGICSLSIVEFVVVLLLALHRLYRWYLWHAASTADTASIAGALAQGDSQLSTGEDKLDTPDSNRTRSHQIPARSSPVTNTRSVNPQAHSTPTLTGTTAASSSITDACFFSPTSTLPTTLVRPTRGHQSTSTIGKPISASVPVHISTRPETAPVIINKTKSQKQRLLHRHVNHITFLHPLLSVAVAVVSLVLLSIRISTDWTLGTSYTMSVLTYMQSVAFLLACSLAVFNTLRAASGISRSKMRVKGLSTVVQWAKRWVIGVCVYASIICLLVFFMRTYNAQQQLMAQLGLCLFFTPLSILGYVSVIATRRITQSLVQDIDLLSAQQQQDRMDMRAKLRRQSDMLALLLVCNTIISFTLAMQHEARQVAAPYFALITHTSTAFILGNRLLLLRPQSIKQTVAPAPVATSPTPLTRVLESSEARVDSKNDVRALDRVGAVERAPS